MQLKFLYALGLLLCLSTIANSNECTGHCRKTTAHPAKPANNSRADAAPATATAQEEEPDYSPSPLIRLLYI